MVAVGPCFVHGGVFRYDPERVPTVLIDPDTGRPPDVGADAQPVTPDPAAVARAVARPYCPGCAVKLNAARRGRGQQPVFDETDTSRYWAFALAAVLLATIRDGR
jgi:hypothetical protein